MLLTNAVARLFLEDVGQKQEEVVGATIGDESRAEIMGGRASIRDLELVDTLHADVSIKIENHVLQ